MRKLGKITLEVLTKTAFSNAKKEASSACLCIAYQPKMPEKVKKMCQKSDE